MKQSLYCYLLVEFKLRASIVVGSIRFLLLLLTQALNLNIQIALIAIFYVRFVTLIFIDSIAMVKHTKSQLAL